MRVVQLDRNRIRQGRQRSSLARVRRQNILQAGADEEVLLLEAQLLALRRGVVRIKHSRQILRLDLIMNGSGIVAGVEGVDLKRRDGGSRPEPQMIDRRAALPGGQLVETDGGDVARAP